MLIAERESKIAEMEAASTGEAARLRAAAETVKGELAHLRHEHVQIELYRISKTCAIYYGLQDKNLFISFKMIDFCWPSCAAP